ncbi:MAG TPA: ABC transporter ATP-binding protein [Ilumatobacteraceae bacterium]
MSDPLAAETPALDATGLIKRYGNVTALDQLDFAVFNGEVLAVIGDNGAGKSTLIKCLAGVEFPDAGSIRLGGRPTRFRGPNDARIAGINTVHQSLRADAALDLATSLFREHQVHPPGGIAWLAKELERRGWRTPRALPTKVALLDEPTAALGKQESAQAMKVIRNLRQRGLPVVVVMHDVRQALDVADRVHVQVNGRRAAVVAAHSFAVADAIAIMSGKLDVEVKDQALGPIR